MEIVKSKSTTQLAVYPSHDFQQITLLITNDHQNTFNLIIFLAISTKNIFRIVLYQIKAALHKSRSIYLMSQERPALTSKHSLKVIKGLVSDFDRYSTKL